MSRRSIVPLALLVTLLLLLPLSCVVLPAHGQESSSVHVDAPSSSAGPTNNTHGNSSSSTGLALSSSAPLPSSSVPAPTDFLLPCPAVPNITINLNGSEPFFVTDPSATLPTGSKICFADMDDTHSSLADSPATAYMTTYNSSGTSASCRSIYISDIGSQNRTGWMNFRAPPYTRSQYPPVAIVVSSAFGNVKSYFYPLIDAISLLQVSRSHNTTWFSMSASTRVRVEMANSSSSIVVSEPHRRFKSDCGYVATFWTVIVTLSTGVPTSIDWEDDKSTCSNDAVVDGNCGVLISQCAIYPNTTLSTTASVNGTDCDLKVYLAWKGTDSAGNVMTSHSRTIANFRRWSFNSLYNSASSLADSGLSVLPVVPCTVDPATGACETTDAA